MATRESVPQPALERLRLLVTELRADGLTQKEIAARIGCAPEHLSRVLSPNKPKPLTRDLLRDTAAAFDFDPYYFEADAAKSYKDFMRTPDRVLRGELGTSRLGTVLLAADALIAAGTDAEPELAEHLAHDVLSLEAVQTAWKVVNTKAPAERQALGALLAWQVRAMAKDPEVIALVEAARAKK